MSHFGVLDIQKAFIGQVQRGFPHQARVFLGTGATEMVKSDVEPVINLLVFLIVSVTNLLWRATQFPRLGLGSRSVHIGT